MALSMDSRSAQEVITQLNLTPHIEEGWYVEKFRDSENVDNRSHSTAIYYLLEGSVGSSRWHRVDASEIWHYYAGAPLRLDLSYNNGTRTEQRVLGRDIFDNQAPQIVIEKNRWQRAESLGEWTLVGATVAPGFVEKGFEIAPPGWEPNGGHEEARSQ